ncbi:MAG TPA: ScbA/BarX family gamma-butyrolactone biosynthesis protein [Actinomycetota bacterium]
MAKVAGGRRTGGTSSTYLTEGLNWSRPLPEELVHRSAKSEVFITSVSREGDDAFLLAARWPRDHTFYHPDEADRHDPMLIAETMRQAGILVAHAGYDVPFGTQFIMADISFYLINPAALIVEKDHPGLVVSLSCSEVIRRGGMLRRARFHVGLLRDGARFAYGSGLLVCIPAGAYEKLRARRVLSPPSPRPALPRLNPAVVGRRWEGDVLLCDGPGWRRGSSSASWRVQVDPDHPAFFDHPLDHLPGMVQLETFRQAALALTTPAGGANRHRFLGCDVRFIRMVHAHASVRCWARTLEAHIVHLELADDNLTPLTEGSVRLG